MKYTATKYGLSYEYDFDDGSCKICPTNEKLVVPDTQYKYYSLADHNIDALIHGYIYASHPFELNDYFDCCTELISYDNPNEIRKIFRSDTEGFNEYMRESQQSRDAQKVFSIAHWHLTYSKRGIVSLTPHKDNSLMWAHYAHNEGFVIGFDYRKFPFSFIGPFPIQYIDSFNAISLYEMPIEIAELIQPTVKSKDWEYEEEWRILPLDQNPPMLISGIINANIYGGHERKFNYPIDAVKSITLGHRFFRIEEMQTISDNELKILIKPNCNDKRTKVLNYLSCYHFDTRIAYAESFQIKEIPVVISRNEDCYTIKIK